MRISRFRPSVNLRAPSPGFEEPDVEAVIKKDGRAVGEPHSITKGALFHRKGVIFLVHEEVFNLPVRLLLAVPSLDSDLSCAEEGSGRPGWWRA